MIDMYDHRGFFTRDYVRSLESQVFGAQSPRETAAKVAHGRNCACPACGERNRNENTPIPAAGALCTHENIERR